MARRDWRVFTLSPRLSRKATACVWDRGVSAQVSCMPFE